MRWVVVCIIWGLVALVGTELALGQNPIVYRNTDSLLHVLQTTKTDTVRIRLLYQIARSLNVKDPKQTLAYGKQAIALADKIGMPHLKARPYMTMAWASYHLDKKDHAMVHAKNALHFNKGDMEVLAKANRVLGLCYEGKDDQRSAAACYENMREAFIQTGDRKGLAQIDKYIGMMYELLAMNPEAYKAFLSSLANYEAVKDDEGVCDAYGWLGLISIRQGNPRPSIAHFKRSLALAEKLENKGRMSVALSNMGSAYQMLHIPDSAYVMFSAALVIDTELGDTAGIAICNNDLGLISLDKGDLKTAMAHFDKALVFQQASDDHESLVSTYLNKGEAHMRLRQFAQAQTLFNEAKGLCQENNYRYGLVECYASLAKLDSATGNWKNAYHNHLLHVTYRDSLVNEENTRKTVQAQMQFEFDKKEEATRAQQELKDKLAKAELNENKIQKYSLAVFCLFALGFAFWDYRQKKRIATAKGIIEIEKQRSDDLLHNILPHEVAEELKAKGEAEARYMDEVTVLFTDFKGFTQKSELVTPKELVRELNECFSAFDRICEKHGIEKIKTIGDAYMAAGGLPTPCADHAQRVVRAALEMRDFIAGREARNVGQESTASGKSTHSSLLIRIGIHSGPVVAGIVGIKKFQYDIWGDTVNTASRMESSGEVGKVNISEATYALVKDDFNCEYRGEIEAKGKGKMGMWFAFLKKS